MAPASATCKALWHYAVLAGDMSQLLFTPVRWPLMAYGSQGAALSGQGLAKQLDMSGIPGAAKFVDGVSLL